MHKWTGGGGVGGELVAGGGGVPLSHHQAGGVNPQHHPGGGGVNPQHLHPGVNPQHHHVVGAASVVYEGGGSGTPNSYHGDTFVPAVVFNVSCLPAIFAGHLLYFLKGEGVYSKLKGSLITESSVSKQLAIMKIKFIFFSKSPYTLSKK